MTPLEEDQWLGGKLGKPAYRIRCEPMNLGAEDLPGSPAFVFTRVDVSDFKALSHLQGLGFDVIDCHLSLERAAEMESVQLEDDPVSGSVRFADSGDEPGVRELAKQSFEFDRFHRDPHVSNDVANRIKEEWAGNFFTGERGTWMVVSEDDRRITGFLQLLTIKNEALVVDLIAVDTRYRRQGVARSMINFALLNCANKLPLIRVGTQLGNSSSLKLYCAMGFRSFNAAFVLHRHSVDT